MRNRYYRQDIVVHSCFDGVSCGRVALERAGIKVRKYYASEINKNAEIISRNNYPDIIRLGDITKWRTWDIEKPDLILAGSPCQGFSVAGKGLNFEDARSALLFTFIELLLFYGPEFFLLENVKMSNICSGIVSDLVNTSPYYVNSEIISGQKRPRLYWTNIPWGGKIKSKRISLQTLPDDYIKGVSKTAGYQCLGNGWTVDVIAHILKGMKNGRKKKRGFTRY